MAETDAKESKGSKRYKSGPKITEAKTPGQTMKDGGTDEAADATGKNTTTKSNKAEAAPRGEDPGAEPAESSGTDGIPVHDVQNMQLKDLHTRHEKERRDLHARHEQEQKTLQRTHAKMGEKYADKGSKEEE